MFGASHPEELTLRAPERVDYGVLLNLVLTLFPDSSDRRKLLWDAPRELFGFADIGS